MVEEVLVNGEEVYFVVNQGHLELDTSDLGALSYVSIHLTNGQRHSSRLMFKASEAGGIKFLPVWLALLPPLLTIFMAIIFKEVILSLFTGIWLGAWMLKGFSIKGFFTGILEVVEKFVVEAIADKEHVSVLLFTLLIGGMVMVIYKNGSMQSTVRYISRFARSRRRTEFATWLLGIAIFFDDYANTLIVGNTMRPLTDRFKISRAKLAYIVDSTAAPVAAVGFVTTWVGAELGYIGDAAMELGIDQGAYSIFLSSLQYAFYPFLSILLVLLLILTRKDMWTMAKAEERAIRDFSSQILESEQIEEHEEPAPAWMAVLPVLIIILGTLIGLVVTGWNEASWSQRESFFQGVSELIGNSDSYKALIWSSSSAFIVAIILSAATRHQSIKQAVETGVDGFRSMVPPLLILVLAWALAIVTAEVHTGEVITSFFSGNVSALYLPEITFILAAAIAFATGSSWGTMAILYPLMLSATWLACQNQGMDTATTYSVFYSVVAAVLSGSVLGDHCSPISDTTILSSLASSCDHMEHVRTQLPYALLVGLSCWLIPYQLCKLGAHPFLALALGAAFLILFVLLYPARKAGENS